LVCLDERLLDGVLGVGEESGPAGEDGEACGATSRSMPSIVCLSLTRRRRLAEDLAHLDRMPNGAPAAPCAAEILAAISTAR
jgi:hypothetical protein